AASRFNEIETPPFASGHHSCGWAVAMDPLPRMLNGSARWLLCVEANHAWQLIHPVVPGRDQGELRQCLLAFGSECDSKKGRQQEVVCHGHRVANQERSIVGKLLFHDLQCTNDVRHSALNYRVIAWNTELWIHETLVRDVIDHLGIEIPIEIADPLVHPR